MTAIVWLRRSMRFYDNMALVEASRRHERVVPFYVVDEDYFETAELGYPRVRFWHDALEELEQGMEENGAALVIRRGTPLEQLQEVVAETDADEVVFNRDYSPYARERDAEVQERLGCTVTTCKDIVLFEKQEILTNAGSPYKVYSYYRDKWFEREKPRPAEPAGFDVPSIASSAVPSPEAFGFERPDGFEWVWDAGRSGGRERLESFRDRIAQYDNTRDYPAKDTTSRLSPHLKFGTVSVRECFWEAERMRARVDDEEGITTWQEELAWRDFYFQMLWNFPYTTEEAFQEQYRGIEWRWDGETRERWERFKQGETGFPLVDAAIRQLRKTGWMHNRLRMLVASFAAKDIKVDWRRLHDFFKRWFVDAETAAMVGGIQWAYSIGTDAQPYFRVFNPWSQGEQWDPEGEFIREMVPELAEVPDRYIHRPATMPEDVQEEAGCVVGEDYPLPMLDHQEERESAIAMFKEERDDG
jgi:deoxyribodipyrimidine photo-lyase